MKLIPKYQTGRKVGTYSENGEYGWLAELPEVTITGNKNHYLAKKWNRDNPQPNSEMPIRAYVGENGDINYSKDYNPGAGFLSGTDPIGELVVGGAALNKPLAWVGRRALEGLGRITGSKAVKSSTSQGENYTNRLIKLLGDKKSPPSSASFDGINKNYADYLSNLGVDSSKFSNTDLTRLRNLRRKSIKYSHPEGRHTTITEGPHTSRDTKIIAELFSGQDNIGTFSANTQKLKSKSLHGESVNSHNFNERGVSEALYNATLKYANQNPKKIDGLITGEILESPEATYNIWKRFNNKKLIGRNGNHMFNHGANIRKTGTDRVINNGPVYKLTKPSYDIPTKHLDFFHPDLINPTTGKLRLPDWNNKDIYRILLPAIGVNMLNNE